MSINFLKIKKEFWKEKINLIQIFLLLHIEAHQFKGTDLLNSLLCSFQRITSSKTNQIIFKIHRSVLE